MSALTPEAVAAEGGWFCARGDFWGTSKQLCLCARCGKSAKKRMDEPRHYAGIFTPHLHMICDECFDTLPDEEAAPPVALLQADPRS